MTDRVGQQLGNYRLVKLLGKGGFAEVYLGQHVHLVSKQAAIKILHLLDVDARRFQEEAETTEQLVHPHIVRLLDFALEQGTPFLVLDFAPGGSLRTRHPKGSVVPLATVGAYLNELVPALQYAHDQHILHRDIKPDNMLIGRGGELLLSDFGIAVLTQTGRTSLSSAYGIGGTPLYMAPETYRGRPEKASDQYALAVVVYEWLCGCVPFSEGDFIQLGYQHSHEPVPPLREQNPAIPPDVEQVVLTALAKNPKQRFGSVLAFATAFEQASQVTQLEPELEPVVPVSQTTETNQSQQPTELATPVPIIPLSQQTVGEVPADTPAQPQTPTSSSGKESMPQAEAETRQAEGERVRQEQKQADNLEEERVRKAKEAEAAQEAEEEGEHTDREGEQARKAEEERVGKTRQESTPSRFPPSAGSMIPQGLRLRFLSWKAPTLLLVLALLILGSGVGLYTVLSISSARTQATVTATAQANGTATAQALTNTTATAQAKVPGRTWHAQHSGTTQNLSGAAWSGSQFVAVGQGGTILTSPDGRTWTAQPSGTSQYLTDVARSGSQFVVVGQGGTILTSPDGRTWTSQSSGTQNELFGVVWSGSQFVVVGYATRYLDSEILTSPDGRTWTARRSGTTQYLSGVAWSGSQFVVVGQGGTILTSPDGRTWTSQHFPSSSTVSLTGVVWSGSQFVVVGSGGTILTSP